MILETRRNSRGSAERFTGKPGSGIIRILAALLMILPLSSAAQEKVVEKVQVTNREVVVRVFDGKKPVSGLTEKDFLLLEDGKERTITSCRELHRAMAAAESSPKDPGVAYAAPRKGRLFLFLLWWNEKSETWPKAWNYFLSNIFRPGDRIVISDGSTGVVIRDPETQRDKLAGFFTAMDQALEHKKLDKSNMIRELGQSTDEFHNSLVGLKMRASERALLQEFKMRYRGVLEEYRLARLRAQPKLMTRLAAEMRSIEAEKWVLVFLQNEHLPLVHENSRLFSAPMSQATASQLKKFIDECDKRMVQAADMAVHVHDMRSLFTGANATFHLFLSDPKGEVLDTDQLRWTPTFSSWESAFRDISRDTGGGIRNTTQLDRALHDTAGREDIFYALTFRPGTAAGSRPKLNIRVNRKGLDVVFARRLEPVEIQPLQIKSLEWESGHLKFSLSGFMRETGADGLLSGNIRVQVSTESRSGKSLDFARSIKPAGDGADVGMTLNFPEPGDYTLHIEAWDEIGDRTAHAHIRVNIPEPEPVQTTAMIDDSGNMSPQLAGILEKTTDYCRRLKKAAFRFYCTELVTETTMEKSRLTKRWQRSNRKLQYDYQVVGAGTIEEQRRLVRRDGKKANLKNAGLDTRIKSRYSVFMPVTLLAVENRHKYHYKLEGTDSVKGHACAVVNVQPRNPEAGSITQGRVWIDMEDGSVLRIEVHPRGIRGSDAMMRAAREMSANLELTANHWYLESHGGLRFPSQTEFAEAYVFDKLSRTRVRVRNVPEKYGVVKQVREPYEDRSRRRVEFYHLLQQYKDYRYFEVNSKVEIQ